MMLDNVELPTPNAVETFCTVCVWDPPPGTRFDQLSGYDVRYTNSAGEEIIVNREGNNFFQLTSGDVFNLGAQDDINVQVSICQ